MEDANRAVESALGTVWTATVMIPDSGRTETMRKKNIVDHGGFVLAGCPGADNDQSTQAATPIPMGIASYIERFLQGRAEVTPC